MTYAYVPSGSAERLGAIEQILREHRTDIQRLLRTQKPQGEVPLSGGNGSSDAGGGLARFQLAFKLYNGITSANAIRLDEPGTDTLQCEYGYGYWFGDEKVFAIQVDGVWQVVGAGKCTIGGNTNTASQINANTISTRTLSNGKSVSVVAKSGNIGANKNYDVSWDEQNKIWLAVASGC